LTARLQPDLLLLDLIALHRYGYEKSSSFRTDKPQLPVIIMNGGIDHIHTLEMMGARASGHFPSDGSASDLVSAIRIVSNGQRYLPPSYQSRSNALSGNTGPMRHQFLTPRELQ